MEVKTKLSANPWGSSLTGWSPAPNALRKAEGIRGVRLK